MSRKTKGVIDAEDLNLLDKQDLARLGISEQANQLGPRKLRAALVLDVFGRDLQPAFGCEGFERVTG